MTILVPEPHDEVCFREDGRRLDGRKADEPRHFACKVGVIKNAQGSAYVEHGGNKIYASVYGPREVHPRHLAKPDRGILRVNYRMATFSVHERKRPAPNRREIEISKVVREALEPVLFLEAYPDAQIEIFIEIIAADGGTRCASTTCASLALADAGIPMKSLVVGIAAGKAQDKIILDLGDKEDKVGQGDLPAAVIMRNKRISLLQFDGEMTPEELKTSFEYIMKGAEKIYQIQLESLKNKYTSIADEAKEEEKKLKEGTQKKDKGEEKPKEEQKQGDSGKEEQEPQQKQGGQEKSDQKENTPESSESQEKPEQQEQQNEQNQGGN